MAAKKGGLGKGLDSLITDKVSMGAATQTAEKNERRKVDRRYYRKYQ